MSGNDAESLFTDGSVDGVAVPLDAEVPFGRYRLCYELGAGGMATVFLARTEGVGGFTKAVALKRIHPHLVKRQGFVSMFLDEARIASLLSHPNVCGAFDFGEVDGTYYIAMEYLSGEALSHVVDGLRRKPAVLRSQRWETLAMRIAADVCEGLHAAHELCDDRGRSLRIVHRDVSPQNVFVTYDGAVKLVDFGVAFARDRQTETVAGTIKGKLAYLAPEQLVVGTEIDRRVDVWALGVTLWESLAGRRLFAKRSDAATLAAIQSEDVPRLSTVRPDTSPELEAILARALAREPDERYQTARELGHDLSELVVRTGRPVGLAQIAELMKELFPDRRPAKLDALSGVMDPSKVRLRSTRTVVAGPPDGAQDVETSPMLRAPPAHDDAPTRAVAAPRRTTIPVWPFGAVPLWPFVALCTAGVAAVVATAWMAATKPEPETIAVELAPPAAPSASPTPTPIPTPTPTPIPTPIPTLGPTPLPPLGPTPDPYPYPTADPDPIPDDSPHVAPVPHHHATPAVHEGTGEARFVCGVWADVRERGRNLGRTPMVAQLRAGRHTVEFVGSDGRQRTRTFELGADSSVVVRCE